MYRRILVALENSPADRTILGDGVLISDGVLMADGVLLGDGVLIGDGVIMGDSQTVLGDNTSCMQPAS